MVNQDHEPSKGGDSLERVLQVLKEIAEKSADDDYLYRGEPKCYSRVSSSLYRDCGEIDAEHFDIGAVQNEILQQAKLLIAQTYEDNDLLAELQHYGYPTNLIDFTTDCLIALFFACDGEPAEDGRVVLLRKSGHVLLEPKSPANRVIAQKSVFVRPPKGYIDDNETVTVAIPHDLKESMLDYLNTRHGLSVTTIYNDIHGFIRYHQGHDSSYREFYAGLTYQNKGEHCKAIERLSNAIRLNPQLPSALMNRGVAYSELRQYERAIQDYNKGLELAPNASELYTNRGDAYRQLGKYDLAIRDLDMAIRLNPLDDKAHDNRGIAHMEKGNLGQAMLDYDRAIKLNSYNAAAHNNRSVAHQRSENYDRAIQDCDKAIELNPSYADAYVNRGVALIGKGELERAIQDFNRAIALNPSCVDGHINRGLAYGLKREYECAIEDFGRAIEQDSKDAVAYIYRGKAYDLIGEHERAVRDFDKAIELDPDLPIAHFNHGVRWLVLGDWAKAEANFSTAKILGVGVVSAFCNEFESVTTFEKRYNIKLPAGIVKILTANGDE